MDFAFRFPAVKGMQAGRPYYIAMVPLRMLPKLFSAEEEYIQPDYRAQRRLNEQRIPEICNYILDNPDTYVFSALAASIDGEIHFESADSGQLGYLEVAMDATFLINDGQHRIAAILDALEESEELGHETISVVFYEDQGLARSQQMFTDLNKHAVRISNSIAELYDARDELAVATRAAVKAVDFIDRYTDKERDNLGKLSASLFTLNMFYKANKRMLGRGAVDSEFEAFLVDYWGAVAKHMMPWADLDNKLLSKQDLREKTIATQSVCLQALGRVGAHFRTNETSLEQLNRLELIDWSRDAAIWSLRTINAKGRIITNESAIALTANAIKEALGIPLTNEEENKEEEFRASLSGRGSNDRS